MSVMGCGKATSGDKDIFDTKWNQTAKRNSYTAAIWQVLPFGVIARVMLFDWGATQSDLVVELFCAEHIFASEPVLALNSPGFTHADLRSKGNQFGVGVTRNALFEKAQILERLHSALDFRPAEQFWIGRVLDLSIVSYEGLYSSHICRHHPRNGRYVIASLFSRQDKFS